MAQKHSYWTAQELKEAKKAGFKRKAPKKGAMTITNTVTGGKKSKSPAAKLRTLEMYQQKLKDYGRAIKSYANKYRVEEHKKKKVEKALNGLKGL